MKYILRLIFCLCTAMTLMLSCVREDVASRSDVPYGIPVSITLGAETRIAVENDDHAWLDHHVTCLRVMGYDTKTKRLIFNRLVNTDSDDSNSEGKGNSNENVVWTAEAEIYTGDFTMVFIANEKVDPTMSGILGDDQQVNTLEQLKEVTLDYQSLQWNGRIPMLAVYDNVQVLEDNHVNVAGTDHTGTWKISMERVAVRVDVTLSLTTAQGTAWQQYGIQNSDMKYLLYLDNVPARMNLLGEEYGGSLVTADYEANFTPLGYEYVPGRIESGSPTTPYEIIYPRIILPEYLLSQKSDAAKAVTIRLGLLENGTVRMVSGRLGYDLSGPDYTMPRNHYFDVKGSIKENSAEIDISIEVKGWSTVDGDPIDDVVLNVSAVKASINERNMARIWFWTTRKREDISVEPATPADAIFTGLTDGSQSNLVFDPATGQGWIDIMTDRESGAADGSYTLMLNAGGLKRSIEVDVKIVGYPLMEYHDYVGAFWRANEVGERVIVIPNNDEKAWTASVEYSTETGTQTGWVKIAAGKSPDPNYWTEDPGEAEDFPVEKDQGTIGGNEHIFFRLGCTGPNTGAAPRYARVKIVWDGDDDPDKNHYLYLRQGEQDDYLMRPTDPAADNSLSLVNGQYRPLSTKYTVYNLTSEEYLNGTKTGGTTIDTHSQLGGSGPYTDENRTYSAFTEYPTQTGGFVTMHARDFLRYILHPINGTPVAGSFSSESGTWATKKDAREVCPKGYRIPDDGPTDQTRTLNTVFTPPVEESEGAQSLFLNPPVDNQNELSNSVKGYYADGFFDRRPLESHGFENHNVVSKTDHRIAHLGVVMFNPWNYGSLFFPLSGTRGNGTSPGGSGQTGHYAFTQTIGEGTTTSSTTLSFNFLEALNIYYISRGSVNAGVSITVRCVPEK
ncbi:MAG: hypothetical protein LUF87_06270 [Alistipes sp.]|nr:hypothetical protein [Alistipes sp.]